MIDTAAAAVAYVAGRLVTGDASGGLVDLVAGGQRSFDGEVSSRRVSIFDRTAGCWILGTSHEQEPLWLFHQQTMRYLTLHAERPGFFTGHDYASHHPFDVLADAGGSVEVLDYENGCWRRFLLQAPRVLVG